MAFGFWLLSLKLERPHHRRDDGEEAHLVGVVLHGETRQVAVFGVDGGLEENEERVFAVIDVVNGKVQPGNDKLFILGLALNVNEAWLIGYDEVEAAQKYREGEISEVAESLSEAMIIETLDLKDQVAANTFHRRK